MQRSIHLPPGIYGDSKPLYIRLQLLEWARRAKNQC